MTTPIAFLSRRRSIPAAFLTSPGPDGQELEQLLTVATRVPDHGKLGPWRFILFEGDVRTDAGNALADLRLRRESLPTSKETEADRTFFSRAPLVIALVSSPVPSEKATEWEQVLSAGAVAMNLLSAAHALGFAANWLTDWPVYDREASAILGVRPGERIAGFFHIGTPAAPPQERWRPDINERVTRWTA